MIGLAAIALSGCADGIELNGKLFDAMGVSSAALDKQRAEPRLPPRGGLVIPPNTAALPPPGSPEAVALAAQQQMPVDPQEQIAMAEAQKEAERAKNCEDDPRKYGEGRSPLSCKGTIWSVLFNSGIQQPEGTTSSVTPAPLPPPAVEEPPPQ